MEPLPLEPLPDHSLTPRKGDDSSSRDWTADEFRRLRARVSAGMVAVIVIFGLSFASLELAPVVILLLLLAYALQGLRQVRDLRFMLLRILGKRTSIVLREGFHFLPVHGVLCEGIVCDTIPETFEFDKRLILCDGSEVAVQGRVTWIVDERNAWAYLAVEGGESDHVLSPLLKRAIEERLAAWAASDAGPTTWKAALRCYEQARAVVGNAVDAERYGIQVTDVAIGSIRPAGKLAEQNLHDLSALSLDVRMLVDDAKAAVVSLADLQQLRAELLAGHPELAEDIEVFVEAARLRILPR